MKAKQSSKNPPSAIKQLIEQAMETRLYILKKYGPTSLKYCDEDGNKFKITLAETMSCTCNQSHQHCVHTIHAMLKVFQVDSASPILWQNSYSSYDITNILSGKYRPQSPKKERPNKKPIFIQQQVQLQKEEPKINAEDLCPICQESLKCDEAIVCCNKQCKNYFHAKCMKVWVVQKQASGKKELPCPMCRADWGEQALTVIRVEERIFESAHKTHKRTCANCKCSPIIGSLFMCIQCPNYVVCEKCIKLARHPHQSFLTKANHSDPYELMGNIGMANLWQLFQDNLNSNKGNDLMLIGTTLSKQSKCNFCLNSKSRILKLLPCGHIADENCLKRMSDLCYVCPMDQQPQFPGLFHSLNKEQREEVMTEIKKWSMTEEQKDKLPPIQKTSQIRQNQQRSSNLNLKRSGSSSAKRTVGDFLTVKQLSGNQNYHKQHRL